VFTQHALEALHGAAYSRNDGLIRVFDLFNYISENVRHSVPGTQHPIFKASALEDNFPVSMNRGGIKQTNADSRHGSRGSTDDWSRLEQVLAQLYPLGPTDQDIWQRSGGDLSRLTHGASGRAAWFSALRLLRLGGGGELINKDALLETVRQDFPHHPEFEAL
jgi:hypothetical protein